MHRTSPNYFFLIIVLLCSVSVVAQEESPDKLSFKDTLDGKMDMSEFLIDFHGFIPMPQLITEPALGNFGFALVPVFIQPNKTQIEGKYTPPTITAAMGGYTANKSWMVGAFRSGAIPKGKLKYRIGGGFANINLDFYRTVANLGEKTFSFNFQSTPIFGSLVREIGNSEWYVGFEYLYLHSKVSPEFDLENFPKIFNEKSFDAVQSSPGILVQFDGRDNIFTPDKGSYVNVEFRVNANWTGSDFNYENLVAYIYQYFKITPNWVSGFRAQTSIQFGDAPFFMVPQVNLRGVPLARYQGTELYLLETEQRYDFTRRWSGVAFGGTAKALYNQSFNEANWVYNYGVGFRYLIARLFKLRMGVDVAWSNDSFGYYITFGSAWR